LRRTHSRRSPTRHPTCSSPSSLHSPLPPHHLHSFPTRRSSDLPFPTVLAFHAKSNLGPVGASLRDFGDGALEHFQFGVRRANGNTPLADAHHNSNHAAAGNDLVFGLERFEQLIVFLGLLLLRPDHDEIHYDDEKY